MAQTHTGGIRRRDEALEERVAARTADLEAVNAQLTRALTEQARGRETLQGIFDSMPVMISIYDAE
jgi:hypothetical protein